MPRRFNKTIRDQAATICAVMASNPSWRGYPYRVAESLDVPEQAAAVAVQAWIAVTYPPPSNVDYFLAYAEAEALLRTGWRG